MPQPATFAELAWCLGVLLFLSMRLPRLRQARKEPIRLSRRDILDLMIRTIGYVTLGVLPAAYVIRKFPRFAIYPFCPPLAVIGGLLFAAGLWFIYRAQNELGRAFSSSLEIRQQHRLVTGGVYHYIRHPLYLGFLLWGIGQALLLPNWVVGTAGLLGFFGFFLPRVRREERMMLEEFGSEYMSYMKRTARLVPWLY